MEKEVEGKILGKKRKKTQRNQKKDDTDDNKVNCISFI